MLTSKKEFGQNIGMSYHIVALINEDRKKKKDLCCRSSKHTEQHSNKSFLIGKFLYPLGFKPGNSLKTLPLS